MSGLPQNSDQSAAGSFSAQAGQPAAVPPAGAPPAAAPAAPAPAEQSGAQPQYLTLAEAQRMVADAEEKAFRRAQGLVEKTNSGVLKKVQENMAALEKSFKLQADAGFPVAPEQAERLKAQVLQQAFTEPEPAPPPAPAQAADAGPQRAPGAPEAADLDPVNAEALSMMRLAGVTIEDSDPEAKLIDQASPYAFLKSVDKAIEAKRTRLGTAQQSTPAAPAVLPTNLGGGALPNSIQSINDPTELLKMALSGRR